jgi:hypothetical protein
MDNKNSISVTSKSIKIHTIKVFRQQTGNKCIRIPFEITDKVG